MSLRVLNPRGRALGIAFALGSVLAVVWAAINHATPFRVLVGLGLAVLWGGLAYGYMSQAGARLSLGDDRLHLAGPLGWTLAAGEVAGWRVVSTEGAVVTLSLAPIPAAARRDRIRRAAQMTRAFVPGCDRGALGVMLLADDATQVRHWLATHGVPQL